MLRKITIVSILIFVIVPAANAADPNDYISSGRASMFEGTVSGLRSAYEIFDLGLKDAGCIECCNNRELIFLHALTRISMWGIRDDGQPVDSALEFAKQFDIYLIGDQIELLEVSYPNDVDYPTNEHDYYVMPEQSTEQLQWLAGFGPAMIPEIDDTIAQLDLITDSQQDPFRIFFTPAEVNLASDLEVDYGEVMILKAGLTMFKAMLQQKTAYDTIIDSDMLLKKNYGGCFSMNDDLLTPYPDFLKVLPTSNDANDGKAILANAKQSWIDGINYYFETINYIRAEQDPQEDDLLYIDDSGSFLLDKLNEKLAMVRDSLLNDTIIALPTETVKEYQVYDDTSTAVGTISLVLDVSSLAGDDGSLIFTNGFSPVEWQIDWFGREDEYIEAEFEYYSDYPDFKWLEGYFQGTMSDDGNTITNATFEYWGWVYEDNYNQYRSDMIGGLSGQLNSTMIAEEIHFDLNPVFGSSQRYPDPLSPRDLLPAFDHLNSPLPNSIAHGLGNDPTLGGIVPDVNQRDWQMGFDLQPGGMVILNQGTITIDGSINEWSPSNIVFNDLENDTEDDCDFITGVDVDKLYLAYDSMYLYGAVTLYDDIMNDASWNYNLHFSYSPEDEYAQNSVMISIYKHNDHVYCELYDMLQREDGSLYWHEIIHLPNISIGSNVIEFNVPLSVIPGGLTGRYISLFSDAFEEYMYYWDDESNSTHLKIAGLGSDQLETITGSVSFADYNGSPIYIQAYIDPQDTESGDSVIASTMIAQPGPYTLEGIGAGWQGYVRAFTPLLGFENPLELEAFDIDATRAVALSGSSVSDVDLVLNEPVTLQKDIWHAGAIDIDNGQQVEWFSFDAVTGGTYTIDLERQTDDYACITLLGRDGDTELQNRFPWENQQIVWACPVGGKYYVKVEDEYIYQGGTYQLRMTNNVTDLPGDISGPDNAKDAKVDTYDLDILASNWLTACSEPSWCRGADIDKNGTVNYKDMAQLADQWLKTGIIP